MIDIIISDKDPKHLEHLRWMFLSEWDEVDPFSSAVTAFDGENIIGGLVFTSYKIPDSERNGLWINALFVDEQYRRAGIASRLITAAEAKAVRDNKEELYVYTDIPQLYLKCGWRIHSEDGDNKILKKALTK